MPPSGEDNDLSNLRTELLASVKDLKSIVDDVVQRQRQINNLAADNSARISRVLAGDVTDVRPIAQHRADPQAEESGSELWHGGHNQEMSERVFEAVSGTARQNSQAEADFNADQGKPLGDQADAIEHVFTEATDLLDLEGVQCRASICRAEYYPLEFDSQDVGMGEDPDYLLIDRLSEQMGYADINVRFATSGDGARVIYIELP